MNRSETLQTGNKQNRAYRLWFTGCRMTTLFQSSKQTLDAQPTKPETQRYLDYPVFVLGKTLVETLTEILVLILIYYSRPTV